MGKSAQPSRLSVSRFSRSFKPDGLTDAVLLPALVFIDEIQRVPSLLNTIQALLGTHRHAVSPLDAGPLFEQRLILQCSALNRAQHRGWTLSSYRNDAGAKVDLVIDRGDRLTAVECKWSRQVGEADLRGLRSLEEVAGKPVEKLVAYRGERRQRFKKGETAVPYRDFLDSLARPA